MSSGGTRRSRQADPVPDIPVAPVIRDITGIDVYEPQPGDTRMVKISCPWHEDRTPSAAISYLGFTCFSCQRKGDAIKLLMEETGDSFNACLSRAKEIAGIEGQRDGRKRRRSSELLGYSRD